MDTSACLLGGGDISMTSQGIAPQLFQYSQRLFAISIVKLSAAPHSRSRVCCCIDRRGFLRARSPPIPILSSRAALCTNRVGCQFCDVNRARPRRLTTAAGVIVRVFSIVTKKYLLRCSRDHALLSSEALYVFHHVIPQQLALVLSIFL